MTNDAGLIVLGMFNGWRIVEHRGRVWKLNPLTGHRVSLVATTALPDLETPAEDATRTAGRGRSVPGPEVISRLPVRLGGEMPLETTVALGFRVLGDAKQDW